MPNEPTIKIDTKKRRRSSDTDTRSRTRPRDIEHIIGYDIPCSNIEIIGFNNMDEINKRYPIPDNINDINHTNMKEVYRNIMFRYALCAYKHDVIWKQHVEPLQNLYIEYNKLHNIKNENTNLPKEFALTDDPMNTAVVEDDAALYREYQNLLNNHDDELYDLNDAIDVAMSFEKWKSRRLCNICFRTLTNLNVVYCSDERKKDTKDTNDRKCTADVCTKCHETMINEHNYENYRCKFCFSELDTKEINKLINFYKNYEKKKKEIKNIKNIDGFFKELLQLIIDLKEAIKLDDTVYTGMQRKEMNKINYHQLSGNIIWSQNISILNDTFQNKFSDIITGFKYDNSEYVEVDYENTNTNTTSETYNLWRNEVFEIYNENMYIGWDETREILFYFVKKLPVVNYEYTEDAYDFINYMKTCEILDFTNMGKTYKEILENWSKISSINNTNYKIYFSRNNTRRENVFNENMHLRNHYLHRDYNPLLYGYGNYYKLPFYYIHPYNYDRLYGTGAFYKTIYPNIDKLFNVGFRYPNPKEDDDNIIRTYNEYIRKMSHMEKISEKTFVESVCDFFDLRKWRKGGKISRKSRKSRKSKISRKSNKISKKANK
jgi:hypothetical protein